MCAKENIMAFDRKEYIQHLVDSGRVKDNDSGSTYASNLRKIEKVIGVSVEEEYEKDECKSLEERRAAWCEEHKGEKGWGNVADGKSALDAYVAYKESLTIDNASLSEKERGVAILTDKVSQEKYGIEELCNILKIFLGRRKKSGEKTSAQNYFYAVYRNYLKEYSNGSEEWNRILETIGTETRGAFSWVASLCSYLDKESLSLADFYDKAKENREYINNNDREENIQGLQFDLEEILSESPTSAGCMYFGFYNALNIQQNKITINKFKEVEIAEIASNTIVDAIRAGSRLYHFIAKNADLLTEIAPSEIEGKIKTLLMDNRMAERAQDEEQGIEIGSFVPKTLASGKKHNIIVFGAPGTGKSHKLKEESIEFGEHHERVTFHPDYTYAHFVGTYKPIMIKNEETGKNEIEYDFVAGPFLRVYLAAKRSPEPILLLIEEINRANVAAVFGDVFQLLDRDEDGTSEYEVAASEDVQKWLSDNGINETKLSLPKNMYIWATMNSADQGVFPMDTAFKRRWNFEYTDLYPELSWAEDNPKPTHWEEWEKFRKNVNDTLVDAGINEDKCMGPFFISPKALKEWIDEPRFRKMFASKVLMYLFEDAAKQKRSKIFNTDRYKSFSGICKAFCEGKKEEIFAKDFFNGDGE